jgi:hypothetical protein
MLLFFEIHQYWQKAYVFSASKNLKRGGKAISESRLYDTALTFLLVLFVLFVVITQALVCCDPVVFPFSTIVNTSLDSWLA